MKIGFLTSYRAQKQYKTRYWTIIHFLEKKGHKVIHSMSTSFDSIVVLSYVEREKIFYEYFQKLELCDIILAECSFQSTRVGFDLACLRGKGKPIVIISEKGSQGSLSPQGEVYSKIEHMIVTEYTKDTLLSTTFDAISFMKQELDKRFTMIFPAQLMARLESHSKKKKLPKAVYIRQILEKSLKEDK